MNIPELEKIVERQEQFGISKMFLVLNRKTKPTKWKVKTPFGICEVANWQKQNKEYKVVFCVDVADVKKYIEHVYHSMQRMLRARS